MSVFYEVLMEKAAEQNYHSRYLSDSARQKAFDQANQRRSKRQQGLHDSRNVGGVFGAVGGGLLGAAHAGKDARVGGALGGALLGGGLGYGLGYLGDKARDARTRDAQQILKMSPKDRAAVLDTRRARRLEAEDAEDRRERRQMARDVRSLKRASSPRGRTRTYRF